MKHTATVTLLLVLLFLITQLVGLATINRYITLESVLNEQTQQMETIVVYEETVIGEPIEVENKSYSGVYILLGVLIGTALLFLLIRFRAGSLWKYWFLLSVFLTLAIAFGVYLSTPLALMLSALFAAWKVYRPNVIIHNLTEVFIYTGIAIIFIPIFSLFSAFVLLILISLYDMFAVWKSKHMITLAKFQTSSKIFAGLLLPYHVGGKGQPTKIAKGVKRGKVVEERTAILGGGDIAFPLLFSGVVMTNLLHTLAISKFAAFFIASIIPVVCAISLFLLLYYAKKDRFYPAMPFLSLGCVVGYGIVSLLV